MFEKMFWTLFTRAVEHRGEMIRHARIAPLFTSARLRGEVDARSASGEGGYPQTNFLDRPSHPLRGFAAYFFGNRFRFRASSRFLLIVRSASKGSKSPRLTRSFTASSKRAAYVSKFP